MIKFIVGLGNPAEGLQNTRHNVGYRFIDKILEQYPQLFDKVESSKNEGNWSQKNDVWYSFELDCYLIKPTLYINYSGESLNEFFNDFFPNKDKGELLGKTLVVVDDLHAKLGSGKIRFNKGSEHNGIKNIVSFLGKEFYQLRLGLTTPISDLDDKVKFVLGEFDIVENRVLEALFSQYFLSIGLREILQLNDNISAKINTIVVDFEPEFIKAVESGEIKTFSHEEVMKKLAEKLKLNKVKGLGKREPYYEKTLADGSLDLWQIKHKDELPDDVFNACMDMALFDGILEHNRSEKSWQDYRFEVATNKDLHDYLIALFNEKD